MHHNHYLSKQDVASLITPPCLGAAYPSLNHLSSPQPLGGHRERPVSLMDRMSALETSSQQWRGRVTQSDATKFTVAHKMASSSTSSVPSLIGGMSSVTTSSDQLHTPTGSPLAERKKRSPCQKVFKSKTGGNIPSLLNKSSPSSPRKAFRRSISTPHDGEKKGGPKNNPYYSKEIHIANCFNHMCVIQICSTKEKT